MTSVICVHFTQLVDHCVTFAYTPHNIVGHTHAKILISALECQCYELTLMVKLLIINVT